jgi:hypothetical protein
MEDEEDYYQSELFGEYPELPKTQWQAVQDAVITEEETHQPSAFEIDMLEGFI